MTKRMPVAFLPHGGGPVTHVEMGFAKTDVELLGAYWRSVRDLPPAQPKALLVVSAHWEEAVPTVMTSPHPPMLYDYSGFPPEAYRITWPAPGEQAARVGAMFERWAAEDVSDEPEWDVDQVDPSTRGHGYPRHLARATISAVEGSRFCKVRG